jgi:hypothetical protein
MLSEVPQDFLSELIITTNLRGIGSGGDSGAAARPSWLNDEFLSGGAGALVHGYGKSLSDYERAIKRLPAADLSAFGASREAPETLQRYLQSLQLGIGDPRLPLLTDGSRIFRAVVPRDDAQLRRIHRFLKAAAPLQLLYSANLALAVPAPPRLQSAHRAAAWDRSIVVRGRTEGLDVLPPVRKQRRLPREVRRQPFPGAAAENGPA